MSRALDQFIQHLQRRPQTEHESARLREAVAEQNREAAESDLQPTTVN